MIPNLREERKIWKDGYSLICGIDEAGRGAIAGPLVSGAVILDPKKVHKYNDSKLLSSKRREELLEKLKQDSLCFAIGIASVEEINQLGIQTATFLSYERAINALNPKPDFLLIDYYRLPETLLPQKSITKGDRLSQSIAAASILAKVTRDNMLTELSKDFIDYNLAKHKGYGTLEHFNLIAKFGASPIHRVKFIDKSGKMKLNLGVREKNKGAR